jgi:hypothetical protein
VEIAVRERSEKVTYKISVALKPNKNWLMFKMKLSGQLVGANMIEGVAEVYLNGKEVDGDNGLVSKLKVGEVLALVTFSVF